MENIISKIKQYLNREKTNVEFNRDHVFYSVLKNMKSNVSSNKRIQVVYVFSEIEKTFSVLRMSSINESTISLLKTEKLYNNLEEELQFYLSISYYPMHSYYMYIKSEYDFAIEDLNVFFDNSKIILKDDLVTQTLAICEQHLNLFRIYFSKKDFLQANKSAKELILLCLYGDKNELISDSLLSIFIKDNPSWQAYILDSIFRRYIYDSSTESSFIDLINLLVKNIDLNNNDFFFLYVKSLNSFYENDINSLMEYTSLLFSENKIGIPDIMLYIIINKLGLIIKIKYSHLYDNYAIIANEYIEKHILDSFNSSYIKLLNSKKQWLKVNV